MLPTRTPRSFALLSILAIVTLGACAGDSANDRPETWTLPDGSSGLPDGWGGGGGPLVYPDSSGGPAVDSGGGPAVDSGGGPAVDSGGGSSVKDLERTLSFTGPGGGEWLHVVRRASGATAASVLTVNRHATHAPPYQSKLVSNVLPGQCKSWHLTGTVSGGDPFTTTVTYCVDGDQVTISHTSAINGTPSGTTQQHGAVSLAPDAAAPYERSLHFVGTGGTEWLHLASQAAGETVVNVRTISYSAALVPPVRDRTVSDIAPLACKIDLLTGTFAVGGGSFSTELKHCRTANAVVIEHAATSGGTNSAWQAHGSIPLH